MPISGIVVTFRSPVDEHSEAIQSLRSIREIEIGPAAGNKQAIVIDSETKRRDQEIWEAVRLLPGVMDVAVAMVAFDEDDQAHSMRFN